MPNVLIIDDDDSVARLLKTHLSDEGYNVSVVDHAEDGLALALKEPPDLIMLDVFLPDATGFQICSQFRKSPVTKTTPIIMMTGAARFPSQQAFGRQRGANEYIFKPFKVIEVGELVHKYIGNKRTAIPDHRAVPSPAIVIETPVPMRTPELQTPAQMLGGAEVLIAKTNGTNGHANTTDNMQALSQFLKQALKKQQVSMEPTIREVTPPEDDILSRLSIPEPVEPLEAVTPTPAPIFETIAPTAAEIPAAPAPISIPAQVHLSAIDPLMEISSLASRLSWLTIAHKMRLLDAQGQSELDHACQALITLLSDLQNSEKSR